MLPRVVIVKLLLGFLIIVGGCILVAILVRHLVLVICRYLPIRFELTTPLSVTLAWLTVLGLFGLLAWDTFGSSARWHLDILSPNSRMRLHLTDITSLQFYDDLGWRVRARLEDVQTGRTVKHATLSEWDSSFDDNDPVMPEPNDIETRWSLDGTSVFVRLGGTWWHLPGGAKSRDEPPPDQWQGAHAE